MSDETFDLYLVQDPRGIYYDPTDRLKGQLYNLVRYFAFSFRPTLLVSSVQDFVTKVSMISQKRGKKIKTLVIAGHGASNHFDIGNEHVGLDPDYVERIDKLKLIAPSLAKDADVYILACKAGNDDKLLKRVSMALGGVRVHGYTGYIWTTSYWAFVTLDDSVNPEDGGHEVVCLSNNCSVAR